jgi:hypothetical protein
MNTKIYEVLTIIADNFDMDSSTDADADMVVQMTTLSFDDYWEAQSGLMTTPAGKGLYSVWYKVGSKLTVTVQTTKVTHETLWNPNRHDKTKPASEPCRQEQRQLTTEEFA